MEELLRKRQIQFRAAGAVMFSVAAGLSIARIISSLISDKLSPTLSDVIFTLTTQAVFLLIIPFLIYKFSLKKSFTGVMRLSSVRKPDLRVMLLCVPLGVCCLIATMGVSTVWAVILEMLGFKYPSGGSSYPATFSVWLLLLNIVLTGVFPGVCEEFANRGGFLTTMRGSFSEAQTIVICGLAFGLFHQNVTQVFYTFLFGMLMAALVIKTKSIFPAILVHFLNNSISVYLDFASVYSLPLGNFFDSVNYLLANYFIVAVILWMAVIGIGVGIFILIMRLSNKNAAKNRDNDNGVKIVEAEGESLEGEALPLEDTLLYKPVARDWAFYIGARVITFITTFCTFFWGL